MFFEDSKKSLFRQIDGGPFRRVESFALLKGDDSSRNFVDEMKRVSLEYLNGKFLEESRKDFLKKS